MWGFKLKQRFNVGSFQPYRSWPGGLGHSVLMAVYFAEIFVVCLLHILIVLLLMSV